MLINTKKKKETKEKKNWHWLQKSHTDLLNIHKTKASETAMETLNVYLKEDIFVGFHQEVNWSIRELSHEHFILKLDYYQQVVWLPLKS